MVCWGDAQLLTVSPVVFFSSCFTEITFLFGVSPHPNYKFFQYREYIFHLLYPCFIPLVAPGMK